jgi:hypothetical protein
MSWCNFQLSLLVLVHLGPSLYLYPAMALPTTMTTLHVNDGIMPSTTAGPGSSLSSSRERNSNYHGGRRLLSEFEARPLDVFFSIRSCAPVNVLVLTSDDETDETQQAMPHPINIFPPTMPAVIVQMHIWRARCNSCYADL